MTDLPTPTEIMPFANSLEEQALTYDRFIALPNAKDLVDFYLFGLPFEGVEGNSIKTKTFNHYINVALSDFEIEFRQPVLKRRFVEPHDYKFQDYMKYGYVQLFYSPVQEVTQVQFQYERSRTLIDIPEAWLRVTIATGQIQIVPTTAAVSSFIIMGSGNLPHIFGAKDYFPGLIYVNYVAGFETDQIPYNIMHWLCLKAAIPMLAIAGDLVLAPGIGSASISVAGLSQSFGTTKNTKGAFSGRIELYQKELEESTKRIKRFYKGIKLTTV